MTATGTTVSVVIPTFDRLVLLRRALESVVGQTRPAEEILVIDDGSTDGTTDAIEAEYPEVVCHRQENRGVSSARNRGVALATGDWIAFLDSDDEWLPTKLERQLAALEGRPDHPLCHTDEIWVRNGRRVNPGRRYAKVGGRIYDACLPLCAISPSTALIRRDLLLEIGGFDEDLPACEDYDLWLRICSRWPVVLVDELLAVRHGGHADQLSSSVSALDRHRIRALEKALESGELPSEHRPATLGMLLEKLEIYLAGVERRGRDMELANLIDTRARWRGQLADTKERK